MNNTALNTPDTDDYPEDNDAQDHAEVIEIWPTDTSDAPLYGDFISEIEIWARRAMASNGFGDF